MSEFANTEKLIELVRERRLLYDLSHVNYKNRDKKAEAWLEIGAAMGFGESKIWMVKWKALRDNYSKFKKNNESSTGQAYKKYKSWPWASQMRFLDDYNVRRTTQSNSQLLIESQNATITDTADTSVDEFPIDDISVDEIDISSHRRKRMQITDPSDKILTYLKEKNVQKSKLDGVDYLFLSYAETFKKFPARVQSLLKLEMATIFARYELQAEGGSDFNVSRMASQSLNQTYASSSSEPNSPWNVPIPNPAQDDCNHSETASAPNQDNMTYCVRVPSAVYNEVEKPQSTQQNSIITIQRGSTSANQDNMVFRVLSDDSTQDITKYYETMTYSLQNNK